MVKITKTEDANFSVITAFPEELTDAVNTDFVLWEQEVRERVRSSALRTAIFVFE